MKLMIYSKQKLANKFHEIYTYFGEHGYILWEGELITERARLEEKLNNFLSKRISTNKTRKSIAVIPHITIEEIDRLIYKGR